MTVLNMTRDLRLFIRGWAHNDPIKIEVLVAVIVNGESAREVGRRLAMQDTTISLWVRRFRQSIELAAREEGIDPADLVQSG